MRKRLPPIVTVLLIALCLGSCQLRSATKHIGILIWSEGVVGYRQARQGLLDGLHANGYREGFNIQIDERSAEGDDEKARQILSEFARRRVDLAVTIGSAACLAAKEVLRGTKVPLVFTVVESPKESGVIDDWSSPGWDATGVAIDMPASATFGKLRAVLPKARRLGIVYVTKYATATAAARHAAETAPRFGFTAELVGLTPAALLDPRAIAQALKGKVDAVFFTADPLTYVDATMQRVLPAFRAAGIPVLLMSQNALGYGALLSVSADFYTIGRQTVPHLVKVMGGMAARDVPSEGPYDYQFTVNREAARELRIPLSWNVLIDADVILE